MSNVLTWLAVDAELWLLAIAAPYCVLFVLPWGEPGRDLELGYRAYQADIAAQQQIAEAELSLEKLRAGVDAERLGKEPWQ